MRTLNIKLWHHGDTQDWSVEINGVLHSHVSSMTVDALTEYAVVYAQQLLAHPGTAFAECGSQGGERSLGREPG